MKGTLRTQHGSQKTPISVVVLTYNEETNIEACLASLYGWIDEIFVVDSGSTDATVQIAERYGAQIVYHPFETHPKQWQWALVNLSCNNEWVLGLDADHRVSTELQQELINLFSTNRSVLKSVEGIYISRRHIFLGKWIKYGGWYSKYILQLFRPDKVYIDEKELVDHHFYISDNVLKIKGDIIEDNQKEWDIGFWATKHIRYARLQAQEEFKRRQKDYPYAVSPAFWGTPDQRIIWLKQFWYRSPLFIRPILYFLYRYFLRAGFLDGKEGFILHILQGFWYRLLVDIYLWQLTKGRDTIH